MLEGRLVFNETSGGKIMGRIIGSLVTPCEFCRFARGLGEYNSYRGTNVVCYIAYLAECKKNGEFRFVPFNPVKHKLPELFLAACNPTLIDRLNLELYRKIIEQQENWETRGNLNEGQSPTDNRRAPDARRNVSCRDATRVFKLASRRRYGK